MICAIFYDESPFQYDLTFSAYSNVRHLRRFRAVEFFLHFSDESASGTFSLRIGDEVV